MLAPAPEARWLAFQACPRVWRANVRCRAADVPSRARGEVLTGRRGAADGVLLRRLEGFERPRARPMQKRFPTLEVRTGPPHRRLDSARTGVISPAGAIAPAGKSPPRSGALARTMHWRNHLCFPHRNTQMLQNMSCHTEGVGANFVQVCLAFTHHLPVFSV
eukprot:364402-Chlamydomonas_euryale.AAC.2